MIDGPFMKENSYIELENLTQEETLQMLPDELKTYPVLVRVAFSNNRKGIFPHSTFQDFQILSSLVEKMLFKRPVSIKGSKTEFSGNFTRKLFLNWVQNLNNAVFYTRFTFINLNK